MPDKEKKNTPYLGPPGSARMQSLSRSPSPPPSISLCRDWREGGGRQQLAGAPRCCFRVVRGRTRGRRRKGATPGFDAKRRRVCRSCKRPPRPVPSPCPHLGVLTTTQGAKKMPNAFPVFGEFAPSVLQKREKGSCPHARTHAGRQAGSCEPEIHWAAG